MVDMQRRKPLSPASQAFLRVLFLSILIAPLLDILLILVAVFVPFQIIIQIFNVPSQFVSLLDVRLIVSEGVVDMSLGVGIAAFLWWVLGERTQGVIARADARIKYHHLKTLEHENKEYVINTKTNKGYLVSTLVEELAREKIIIAADPAEIMIRTKAEGEGFLLTEREATIEELGLDRDSSGDSSP